MEIDLILETSKNIKQERSVLSVLSKAVEEFGEVATEINKGTAREAQREIADTIITLVDLHFKLGGDSALASSTLLSLDIEDKVEKWKSVYGE